MSYGASAKGGGVEINWQKTSDLYTLLGATAGYIATCITIYDRFFKGPKVILEGIDGWAIVYAPGSTSNLQGPESLVRFSISTHLRNEGEPTTVGASELEIYNAFGVLVKRCVVRPSEGLSTQSPPLGSNENRGYNFLADVRMLQDWERHSYRFKLNCVRSKSISRFVAFKFSAGS